MKIPIKVLSLFDGISCGMVALERANIPVERYVAYEINDKAIQISKKNYPFVEQREKDDYHTEPFALPRSMDEYGGYGYLRERVK